MRIPNDSYSYSDVSGGGETTEVSNQNKHNSKSEKVTRHTDSIGQNIISGCSRNEIEDLLLDPELVDITREFYIKQEMGRRSITRSEAERAVDAVY